MSLADVKLTLVESPKEVEDFLRWLGERRPVMGVDTETTGLSVARDEVRLVQFGDANQGWAIPYREWRGVIRYVLEEYNRPMVLQHAKFDAGMLQRDGLSFPWERVHDTMLMCFLYDSLGPKKLKTAAVKYVDPAARVGELELKKAMTKNRWGYGDIPIDFEPYWAYGALDTVLTARLAEALWQPIQPYREAYDLELACERVLCDMELRGMMIDVPYCERALRDTEAQLEQVHERLNGLNPSAPRDVAEALQREGHTLTKRTPAGGFSVDDEVLSALVAVGSQVAANVLESRALSKLKTAYFENFLSYNVDGILHPHINQLAARTGRMSVTEPALQTIPRKAFVRDAFIPRPGNKLVLVDYASQELRVAAHIGQDEALISAFREGRDPHNITAETLYGKDFTKANRTTSKNAMYSFTYGAGAPKFARTAGVPLNEAEAVFSTLKRTYPGVTRAMRQVEAVVRERMDAQGYGYVQLLHDGRRLRVRGDKAYQGLNTLIQGSCAVVLKRSLVDLDAVGLGPYLVLPVHDEVAFDAPAEEADMVVATALETMERDDFAAPLTCEANVVDRWGDRYE